VGEVPDETCALTKTERKVTYPTTTDICPNRLTVLWQMSKRPVTWRVTSAQGWRQRESEMPHEAVIAVEWSRPVTLPSFCTR